MTKEEFQDKRSKILEIITPLVEYHNNLLHDDYRISEAMDLGWIKIQSGRASFNGCLLKDIAMLSEVYSWSFVVSYDNEGIYCLL